MNAAQMNDFNIEGNGTLADQAISGRTLIGGLSEKVAQFVVDGFSALDQLFPSLITYANAETAHVGNCPPEYFFGNNQRELEFSKAFQKCEKRDSVYIDENLKYFDCHNGGITECLINKDSRSILQEAIAQEKTECASDLISRQMSVTYLDYEGNSSLHYAAGTGNDQIIDALRLNSYWSHKHIDFPNKIGQTALHKAAEFSKASTIAKLIEMGANDNIPATYQIGNIRLEQVTPFQLAVIKGDQASVEAFFRTRRNLPVSHPDLDLQVPGIGNAIHLAIHFNQYNILENLLSQHWDLFEPHIQKFNNQNETPLMLAARLGNARAVQFLQKKHVNLEQKNNHGQRAIHFAAIHQQSQVIDLLNYYRVKLTGADDSGSTPRDYLQEAVLREKNHSGENNQLLDRFDFYLKERDRRDDFPTRFDWLAHPPENLVFKGGGPKGIAYMGALLVLEENGLLGELKRVAGTSAGAIQSSLMALGYKSDEMIEVFNHLDPTTFLDHPFTLEKLSDSISKLGMKDLKNFYDLVKSAIRSPSDTAKKTLLKAVNSLWKTTGICDGTVFREWLDDLIATKAAKALGKTKEDCRHLTFGELRKNLIQKGIPGFRHLYIQATNLQSEKVETINSEESKWDRVILSDAVRASMSIPGVFKPHVLHVLGNDNFELGTFDAYQRENLRRANKTLGTFVDGGLIANYPIEMFDYKRFHPTADLGPGIDFMINPRTLGLSNFWAVNRQQKEMPLETVGDLLRGVADMYRSAETIYHNAKHENALRTLDIDNLGVALHDFATDPEPLIQSGLTCANRAVSQFTGEISADIRLHLEANGIKLPQKRNEPQQDVSLYLETLQRELLGQPSQTQGRHAPRKAILKESGSEKMNEVAISFKNLHSEQFSRILWITPNNIYQSYKALAKSLMVDFKQGIALEDLRLRVHKALEQSKEAKPYLLIFENFQIMPPLPQGQNGRYLILAPEYFLESPLRNQNCDATNCNDLDGGKINPREQKLMDIIYNGYFSTPFKKAQEYLRLRKDDPRDAFLYFSAADDLNGALDPQHSEEFIRHLSDKYDLKFVYTKKVDEICSEVQAAAKTKKIAGIALHAHSNQQKGILLSKDAINSEEHWMDGRNSDLFPCFSGLDPSGTIALLTSNSGASRDNKPNSSLAQEIADKSQRGVIGAKGTSWPNKRTVTSTEPFTLFHPSEKDPKENIYSLFLPTPTKSPRPLAPPRNSNCETKKCKDLDESKLDPREQKAMDFIYNGYFTTPFKKAQEYLRFRKDDARDKFLYVSADQDLHSTLDTQLEGEFIRPLAEKHDLKFVIAKNLPEVCSEIEAAAKTGKLAGIVIQAYRDADKGFLLSNSRNGEENWIHGNNPDLSSCFSGLDTSGKITFISRNAARSQEQNPSTTLEQEIADQTQRTVIGSKGESIPQAKKP